LDYLFGLEICFMHADIVDLRQFYHTRLGLLAEQSVAMALSSIWANLPGND
jgi:hypothetical protein